MSIKESCIAVCCMLSAFFLASGAATLLRTQAFYIIFQEQIQSARFPSEVCLDNGDGPYGDQCVGPMGAVYKGGVIVAQPVNMTGADVQKLKASVPGAVVLAYWCLDCIPIRPADSAQCPCCTGHIMGDKPNRNCSTSYHCAESSAYQSLINLAFPAALARNQLFPNGSSAATCIYPGQAYYVPSAASVKSLAPMLAAVVAEAGFDGVYIDNYIHPDTFSPPHDPPGLLFDYNGDGLPETRDEVIAQYRQFAPAFSAALRHLLPEGSILLGNSAGRNDDPSLNGITLEMEACTNAPACVAALQESHDLGSKPSVSVMWLTHGESMPANVQCAQVARIQAAMPWVQAGTDFFDGSHIVCNATVPQ